MSHRPGERILTKTINAELEPINAMRDNTTAYADSARNTHNEATQQATQAIHRHGT